MILDRCGLLVICGAIFSEAQYNRLHLMSTVIKTVFCFLSYGQPLIDRVAAQAREITSNLRTCSKDGWIFIHWHAHPVSHS